MKTIFAALLVSLVSFNAWSFELKDVAANGRAAGEKVRALPNGMVVYTFDIDGPGQSNCAGDCAEKWPPVLLTAAEAAAIQDPTLGTITRANRLIQLTVDGAPVYTFYLDRLAGDVLGDGAGGVWHVIAGGAQQPAPAPVPTPAPTNPYPGY